MKSELYNLDYLRESFNNDETEILDMLEMFIDIVPASVAKMKDSLANEKREELKKTAHRLKTSFMLFQSNEALNIAKGFETGEYDLLETHTSLYRLDNVVKEIVRSLKKERKAMLST